MGEPTVSLSAYIAEALLACPPLARYATPWRMTAHAADVVRALLPTLGVEFAVTGEVAVHRTASVEAGAVLANYWNEREHKEIAVILADHPVMTGVEKFGALVGDGTRIGANAVTSPGTLLLPRRVVGRLTLVNQVAEHEARQRNTAAMESHSC